MTLLDSAVCTLGWPCILRSHRGAEPRGHKATAKASEALRLHAITSHLQMCHRCSPLGIDVPVKLECIGARS